MRRAIHDEVGRVHSEGCETKIAMLEDDLERARADLKVLVDFYRAEHGELGAGAQIDAMFFGPRAREALEVVSRNRQA